MKTKFNRNTTVGEVNAFIDAVSRAAMMIDNDFVIDSNDNVMGISDPIYDCDVNGCQEVAISLITDGKFTGKRVCPKHLHLEFKTYD